MSPDRVADVPELILRENSIMKRRLSPKLRQKKLPTLEQSRAKYENVLFSPKKNYGDMTFSDLALKATSQKYTSEIASNKNGYTPALTVSTFNSSSGT